MMKTKIAEYDKNQAIYAFDRSKRNMGIKQGNGTIILRRGQPDAEIYKFSGSMKALNGRRVRYNLKPIEQEQKSEIING